MTDPKRLLTVTEFAALMPNISKNAVYKLVKDGKIKVIKIGKKILIPAFEIERVIENET